MLVIPPAPPHIDSITQAMSAGLVNSRPFHRKPVAQPGTNTRIQPLTSIYPDQQPPRSSSLHNRAETPIASTHNHTRTTSSAIFPGSAPPTQTQAQDPQQPPNRGSYQAYMNQHAPSTRRTLSNGTASTSSTSGGGGALPRKSSSASSNLQRSISSRSGNSPTSYVALMRKQKATVWCDRAQVSS